MKRESKTLKIKQEEIKSRVEINGTEDTRTIQKMNKVNTWLFATYKLFGKTKRIKNIYLQNISED